MFQGSRVDIQGSFADVQGSFSDMYGSSADMYSVCMLQLNEHTCTHTGVNHRVHVYGTQLPQLRRYTQRL